MDSKPELSRDRLTRLLAAKAAGKLTFPLSWAQERMWFLAQLEPDSGAYTIVSSNRLGTVLDPGVLKASFTAIAHRHAALRTVFPLVDGRPVQRVLTDAEVPVRTLDLRGAHSSEPQAAERHLVEQETTQPFDLATGPLLRVTLARLGASESLLIIAVHHIVIDGWSFDILLRELNATYRALSFGLRPSLPALEIQYPDWSIWQRRWLTVARMAGQLRYWNAVLADAPPLIDWPADHPRPPHKSGRGAAYRTRLVDPLTTRLLTLGQQEQATPFMTVLAGYVALLHRWSGETDLVVGTPVANRPRAELHDLIGLFLNTLALRVRCEPGVSFRELLRRTRDATLGALSNQDLPFERLVEDLRPVRDLSHTPIFQTMFVLRSAEPSDRAAPDAPAVPPMSTSKFDLSINAYHSGDIVDLLWEYSTDLFEAGTVIALSEVFPQLLTAACAEPDRAVDELPVAGLALPARPSRVGSSLIVRGFRIDPLVVDAAISGHPGVAAVRLDVRFGATGETELVAEVTAQPGATVSAEQLRRAASAVLPGYMVPARIVLGHPAPERRPAAGAASVEARLAAIWADILGVEVEHVGRDDNFFQLGGHSLTAAQIIARLRDSFQREIPLRAIFEAPTIAELAAELSRSAAASGPPLACAPRTGDLPLSFAQERGGTGGPARHAERAERRGRGPDAGR